MTFPSCRLTGAPITEAEFARQWAHFARRHDGQQQKIPREHKPPASKGPYVERVIRCIAQGHSQRETAQIVGCSSGCVSQIVAREKLKVTKREWAKTSIEEIAPAVLAELAKGRTQAATVRKLGCTQYAVDKILSLEKYKNALKAEKNGV